MDIRGFIPTSLVDWNGKIVSVVFTPRCNFRCSFCFNRKLLIEPEKLEKISVEQVLNYLKRNSDFLDGVCITGGEPLLQNGLEEFCRKVKSLGMMVKLDTNGAIPSKLKRLIEKKLIDYIAMDIKAPLEKYEKVARVKIDKEKIEESIKLIIDSKIDHEMRSTILPRLHSKEDITEMAKSIRGAKKYFLQQFVPGETLDPKFKNSKQFTQEEFEIIKNECNKYICTELRI